MSGWVKLYRKLTENPLWTCEPFTRGQAWVDLILLTNHADNFFYKRGVKVDVSRGQCAWSELALSKRWQWSRNKVRKFLNDLEKEQQIIQQKNNVTQILTLVNYEEHQEQKTPNETPKGQQKDTKGTLTRMNKNAEEYYKSEILKSKNPKYKLFVDYIFGENMLKKPLNGVLSITEQLSANDFEKVMEACERKNKKIGDMLTKIENDKKYYKGKTSLYRTLLNWVEDRFIK